MKKILEIITSPKFLRFFIVGVSAFVLDTIVLNFVHFRVFNNEDYTITLITIGTLSLGFAVEKIISSIVGSTASFLMNRYWAFKATHESIHTQAFKFLSVVVLNAVLGAFTFVIYEFILESYFAFFEELIPTLANIATTGTIMVVSYFFYSTFVFRGTKSTKSDSAK